MSKCKLIVFSDIHYLDKRPEVLDDNLNRKLTQFSIPILDKLIEEINNYRPDICVCLGDLIEDTSGNTTAEIVYNRVDSEKDNMGLTNWTGSPNGPIYKYDVDIAKNYLTEKELKNLNRIFTMYLDYAELQAENHNAMTMKDWVEKLDAFLQFNGQDILRDAGKISHKVAQELAFKEYDKFKKKQDQLYISDFDKFIESTKLLETAENNKD